MTTTSELDVELRESQATPYLGLDVDADAAEAGPAVAAGFQRIYGALAAQLTEPVGPPFLIAAEPAEGRLHLMLGVPIISVAPTAGPFISAELPRQRVAVLRHHGAYDDIGPLYGRLAAWIGRHGYAPDGTPREVYLTDPGSVADPSDYVTELVWPVRNR